MGRVVLAGAVLSVCLSVAFSAQQPAPATAARVDFVRDVQPILQAHCVECHGPDKQMNGYRLDRRGDARRGGAEVVLVPGSAETSKLYLRLLGDQYGAQMPKDDTITPAQIATIRRWIDEGLDWPDAASGEPRVAPIDSAAVSAIAALRRGDRKSVTALLAADRALPGRRGPGGGTPLMFAALYGDTAAVIRMLEAGADPNLKNDAGATALMWAASHGMTARALIERGADVNAKSEDGRTPLLIAAGVPGAIDLVRLLLDRGANPDVRAAGTSPLSEAARLGDAARLQLLLDRGAKLGAEDPLPLFNAIGSRDPRCFEILASRSTKEALTAAMTLSVAPFGDGTSSRRLLERGADPAAQSLGFGMLMLAAASDANTLDLTRALAAKGLDVNAPGAGGISPLTLAKRHGATPMVEFLVKNGARDAAPVTAVTLSPVPADSPRTAVRRSLPLLQRSDVTFLNKTGCVSCHNNTLTAVTVAAARARGVAIDETIARSQRERSAAYLESWRERVIQGHGVPGDHDTIGYLLDGLAAERHPPDASTDAMARFLLHQQSADGSWHIQVHRPPIESSDIQVTVMAIRGLRAYAAPADRARANAAIARAATWLRNAKPVSTEDRAFKLLGLAAMPGTMSIRQAEARALLAQQRADGGWAQTAALDSDAYATGQALVALATGGMVATSDAGWQKGIAFLLRTQYADGSWHVRSRAIPFQPQFNAELPHGRDQFISAAATNWATQALIYAVTKSGT